MPCHWHSPVALPRCPLSHQSCPCPAPLLATPSRSPCCTSLHPPCRTAAWRGSPWSSSGVSAASERGAWGALLAARRARCAGASLLPPSRCPICPPCPAAEYPSHFSAVGANAIVVYDAANCWVRDVSGGPASSTAPPSLHACPALRPGLPARRLTPPVWLAPLPSHNNQIAIINADNGVNMGGVDFVTVNNTRLEFTRQRWVAAGGGRCHQACPTAPKCLAASRAAPRPPRP